MPFNLVTTNDIIGGNSGSPMINRDGQIVGLAFGFDEALNRTVAVDSRAIKETLKKIYKAERLLAELP